MSILHRSSNEVFKEHYPVNQYTSGDHMKSAPIPYGQHTLDEEDVQAVVEVLRSGVITQGDIVEEFGQAIADYVGARYGVAVANGTAALHLAVRALDIGPGDEVITCPMTFCATSNAVLYEGGSVVFADIDEVTCNIDPQQVAEKITERTKAIIPVDFRGHPADLGQLRDIADHHGLAIIEDGAHSIGSRYKYHGDNYMCGDGQHAELTTFSFHPVKHITTGEGGLILTNNEELYRRVFFGRKHGIDRRPEMFSENERVGSWIYDMEAIGFNYRLTDFQAALGLSQLRKIDDIIRRRRLIVNYYNEHFAELGEFVLPYESPDVDSNFHLYILQVNAESSFDRYDLFVYLQSRNYRPMVHYIPVHLLSYYSKTFGYKWGDFPVAEAFYRRAITLPLYPGLTDAQVEQVVRDIKLFVKR